MAGRNRTCGASRFRRPLYRAELRPRVSGQGWTRTSSLLFVRQALCAIELLAQVNEVGAPGQGFEPRPPRSERGVLAVRRSRKETLGCSCHSPTLRPWIAAECAAAARHRGGVLEPGARIALEIRRQKQPSYIQRHLPRFAGEDLSLSGGASMSCCVLFKLGITSFRSRCPPSNDEGGPLGPPSLRAAMPLQD